MRGRESRLYDITGMGIVGATKPTYENYASADGTYNLTNQDNFAAEKIGDFTFQNPANTTWSAVTFEAKKEGISRYILKRPRRGESVFV